MAQENLTPSICPKFDQTFKFLGKKWNGLIIEVLLTNECRFKDLSQEIPEVSDRVLVERLRELEDLEIVERNVGDEESGSKITYRLTKKGQALRPIMDEVQNWADYWM